ncbi:sensor domain-containing protein [Halomonas daqiaonensis]|uniref:cyclic-guanylate-specific phosphodiesterase n=1 Tax=Halomonas daqiaonensis TaxID=650850 RepID=A0A1H7UBM9_9GAMM|nr:bifunctional diguanylate cyclase/phosphodiesterase [Halomonas daqiaonensis]SEL94219.1 PAS domain S-box-containing protein/diguanylate cyclase (GGDEF) domain-containing protein [Halomonas daqiaonensis]
MPVPPSAKFVAARAPPWLEALPDSAVLIDESGTILAVNAHWRAFALANGGASHAYLGENYLAVCPSVLGDDVGDLPLQMEDVLKGTSHSLEWEVPCHSPSERRWFRLTASRYQDQGRNYALVIHHDISHRRLADETAKAHEQQLESILSHTREGLVVIQGQGTIRYANPRACELLGDSQEHLIDQNLRIPIPCSTGQILEVQPAGDEPRTLEIYDVQSEWEGDPAWLVHLHDITGQVAAERALKENEDLLERTNRVARVGGWETDMITGELWWTSVTRDILEVDRTEPAPPLNEALPRFYKGESYQQVRTNLQHAIDHGVTADFDTQLQTGKGRTIWVRIQAQPEIQDGKTVRLLGTFQDITERKELKTRLAEWGAAFEAVGEGVIITDAEDRISAVNPAFTTITGYSEDEVRGCTPSFLQFDAPGGNIYEPLWAQLKEQDRWQGEIWSRRKDGEVFPTWQTINSIKDEAGTITHYVSILTDLSRIKHAEQQWEYLANHDPLTGLPNRRLFKDRLEQAVLQARRSGETFAVLLLDMNDFKALNDGFGHDIGDQALRALGTRVKGLLKEDDTLARWGGDELLLLVRDLADPTAASPLAERVLDVLEAPLVIGTQEFRLTASIGIAIGCAPLESASSLIMQADGAMYSAKDAGQRFAFFAKEVGEAARERIYLGTELARALEWNQLAVHYQPQVDLHSGQCLGLEALARWPHPDEGWISPARFIPVAEQSGLIHKLGEWVLETACRQAVQWLADGWDFGRMAVNISSQQLNSNSLIAQVDRVLNKTGLPPTRLELELTESSLVDPSISVSKTLDALRYRGIHIAIDDFGTGYSSLGYLKDLPVDRLKIDRSFVDGLPEDNKARALVETVMTLGSKLGFQVLAEGIETPAQHQDLLQAGCLAGQGYLFAKPLDPESIWALKFPFQVPFGIA